MAPERENGRLHRQPTFEFLWFFDVPKGSTLVQGTRLTSPADGRGYREALSTDTPVYRCGIATEARTRKIQVQCPVHYQQPYPGLFISLLEPNLAEMCYKLFLFKR